MLGGYAKDSSKEEYYVVSKPFLAFWFGMELMCVLFLRNAW